MSTIHPQVLPTTGTPSRTLHGLSSSIYTWLILMAYLTAIRLAVDAFFPNAVNISSQAAFFSFPALGLWTVPGLVGIWFAHRTGFPGAWDQNVSNRQRFVLPVLLGLGFGALFVGADVLTHFARVMAAANGFTQQYTSFVPMALIFPAAAVIIEVTYRLFLIPVLLWLISNVLLRGRGQATVFWILAVLSSLVEPLVQGSLGLAVPAGLVLFLVLHGFALNLGQATLFRRYGFLAAIAMRVAYYVIWHVLYVH